MRSAARGSAEREEKTERERERETAKRDKQ